MKDSQLKSVEEKPARSAEHVETPDETDQKIQNYFLSAVLLVTFYLVFILFRPYIAALLLALVLAVIFHPMQNRLAILVKSSGWAAVISTLIVIAIILAPVAFFLGVVVTELAAFIGSGQASNLLHHATFLNYSSFDLQSYIQNALSGLFNNIGSVLSNLFSVFAFIGITVITLFFFFKEGPALRDSILGSFPLRADRSQKLTEDMGVGIRAVIGGYVLVALIHGVVSGAAFWLFGLPQPALWAAVTVVAALIPSVGASIVYAAAILFLFSQHHIDTGIGLLFWWIVAIAVIDNFVGPRFISGRSKINIVLILFSILGGLKLFGPVGFVVGPTIIIFFWSVLGMFQESGLLPGTNPVTEKKESDMLDH
jgi:predicted PurR-regulated permease PerM